MQQTVLQEFTALNILIGQSEASLSEARERLDRLAAQFGFVETPPLPQRRTDNLMD